MAEKNKNPEVRFAGYTDDWEQHELGEVLIERKILQKISDDAPILAFASGQGVIDRSERKSNNRDHLTLDPTNKNYLLTEYNDIVYNPSNLKYGAIDRNKHGKGVISPIYVTFTTEEEPSFIELIVKSEKFKLRALQYEEGTVVKRQSVNPENLLSLDVKISPSRDEQKKIGVLFEQLDIIINLHQRKYNKLVTVKKAMLEKMFPQNGADVPEIRFEGFTEAWEEKELSDEVEFYTGLTYSPNDVIKEGGTFVLRSSNVKNGEIVYGDNVYVNSNVINCDNVRMGDIIIVVRNGSRSLIGKHAQIKEKMNSTVIGAFMTGINSNQSAFTNALLDTAQFDKEIEKNLGATINQITTGAFKKMQFMFPNSHEQHKIGNYFTYLDNLIALQQRELEKLKNIKKACLEKMFV